MILFGWKCACLFYGNELTEETTPIEAGLSWFVDLTKDFIGKEALVEQIEKGVERKLIGFGNERSRSASYWLYYYQR